MDSPMSAAHATKYNRYKDKQDDLAVFLGIAGRLCNAPPHLTEPDDGQQRKDEPEPDQPGSAAVKGRLKGKARKLAKETAKAEAQAEAQAQAQAQAQAKPKTEVRQTKKYTLRLANYVPLAKHIAASKSVHSTVPTWVLSTLSKIIRDRQELLDYWCHVECNTSAFLEKEDLQRQNYNHQYMIELLLEVKEILQVKYNDQQQEATKAKHSRSDLSSDAGHTRFPQNFNLGDEGKEGEEHAGDFDNKEQQKADISAWKAQAITTVDISFEAEIDISFADAVQTLYDLCQKWQDMRKVVSNAWIAYLRGEVDLGAVALTANTAIDLARHLEELIRPLITRNDELCRQSVWKDLEDKPNSPVGCWKNIYSGIYQCLFGGALFNFGEGGESAGMSMNRPGPRKKDETAKLLDHFFITAFQELETYHSISSHSKQGDTSFGSRRFQMPYGQTRREDCDLSTLDWAEMMFFGIRFKEIHLFFVDEVTHAMVASTVEADFGLWTAFAWQLFLDARILLGPKSVSRPFEELQTYLAAAEGLLKEVINAGTEKLHRSEYPEAAGHLALDALDRINAMRVDWVQQHGHEHGYLSKKVGTMHSDEPFRLWRRHPIYCGLALQSARIIMAAVGSVLERTGARAIIRMAHLYNACGVDMREKGDGDSEALKWEDMEQLVVSLQPENVFIGGLPPTTRYDCAKNYALVEGVPLSSIGVVRPKLVTVQDTLRQMRRRQQHNGTVYRKTINAKDGETFPISFQFKGRLLESDNRRNFTVDDLSLILKRSVGASSSAQKQQTQPPKHRGAQPQSGPAELLADLLSGLDREAPVLKSSYARLYMDCLFLLRTLDARLEPHIDLKKVLDGSEREREDGDGRQVAGRRVAVLLAGGHKCVAVATSVLVRWLKTKGGDRAVLFPAPPSRGAI